MRLPRKERAPLRAEMQMTSMIDVVFQLLIFFVMTLRISAAEGDLAIKMPRETKMPTNVERFIPPLAVHLTAGERGELLAVTFGDEPLSGIAELQRRVINLVAVNGGDGDGLRVDLVCDPRLRYEHAIAALTAISGRREANGKVTTLVSDVQIMRGR